MSCLAADRQIGNLVLLGCFGQWHLLKAVGVKSSNPKTVVHIALTTVFISAELIKSVEPITLGDSQFCPGFHPSKVKKYTPICSKNSLSLVNFTVIPSWSHKESTKYINYITMDTQM